MLTISIGLKDFPYPNHVVLLQTHQKVMELHSSYHPPTNKDISHVQLVVRRELAQAARWPPPGLHACSTTES